MSEDRNAVVYGRYEYRYRGGEIHRRPLERWHLTPADAAWLVLNQPEHYVPPIVKQQFTTGTSLRFD